MELSIIGSLALESEDIQPKRKKKYRPYCPLPGDIFSRIRRNYSISKVPIEPVIKYIFCKESLSSLYNITNSNYPWDKIVCLVADVIRLCIDEIKSFPQSFSIQGILNEENRGTYVYNFGLKIVGHITTTNKIKSENLTRFLFTKDMIRETYTLSRMTADWDIVVSALVEMFSIAKKND